MNLFQTLCSRWLGTSPELNQLTSNLTWGFAEKILRLFASIFVGAWVARYLEPEAFGLLSTALAIVALISVLANVGLQKTLVHELVTKPKEEGAILGTAAVLITVASLVSLIVTVLIAWLAPISREMAIAVLLVGTMFFGCPDLVFRIWFQGKMDDKQNAIAGIISLAIATVVRIWLIMTSQSLPAFAIALGGETILAALIRWWLFKRAQKPSLSWTFQTSRAAELLKIGAPQILGLFALLIYTRMDTIMVKAIAGDYSAGVYSAAARLAEALYFIPVVLSSSLLPFILRAKETSQTLYQNRIRNYLKLNAALGYGIAIAGSLLAAPVIHLLYGPAYSQAAITFNIYVWATIPYFLGCARQEYFVAEGLLHLNLPITVLGAITNVVLNYFFIPAFGVSGAALATLISYSFAWLGSSFLFRETRPVGWMMLKALILPLPSLRGLRGSH